MVTTALNGSVNSNVVSAPFFQLGGLSCMSESFTTDGANELVNVAR
jgi:hypothetical protein